MITSEAVRFIPFHYIAFAIFQSAVIGYIFDVFYTLRPCFKGNRIIDVAERTGLWETCGFRAGGAARVSPSVGVLSGFGNRAFFFVHGDHGGEPIAFSPGPTVSLSHPGGFCSGRGYLCCSMIPQLIFRCGREILHPHQGTLTH